MRAKIKKQNSNKYLSLRGEYKYFTLTYGRNNLRKKRAFSLLKYTTNSINIYYFAIENCKNISTKL